MTTGASTERRRPVVYLVGNDFSPTAQIVLNDRAGSGHPLIDGEAAHVGGASQQTLFAVQRGGRLSNRCLAQQVRDPCVLLEQRNHFYFLVGTAYFVDFF